MYEARLAAIAAAIEAGDFVIRQHALDRMVERRISSLALSVALTEMDTEIIEDYPTDDRGPCCLVLCWIRGRACHALVGYPPAPILITAYWPDDRLHDWEPGFRRRRR